MRKLTHYITPGLMAAALLLAPAMAYRAVAQTTPATPAATPTPEDAECDALYNTFKTLWDQKKQAEGFEAGKAYLAKCGTRTDEFTTYVRTVVTKYEEAKVLYDFNKERAKGANGSPSVIYQNGRILIAKTPDNMDVIIPLAYYGAAAFEKKDLSYKAEALNYSKQAIQRLEAGSAPVKWDPFVSKDQALGWLYHGLASLVLETAPAEAQGYLFKANTFTSTDLPKANDLYKLALSYDLSVVEPAKTEYMKYDKQPVSPESEAATTKYFQVMDRSIDYYARAIAAMGTLPAYDGIRATAKEVLTAYYKFRHPELEKTIDASVTSYVAGVNKTPMPDPKSPLPELPKPATPPAATGGTPSGTTGAASGNTGTGTGAAGSSASPRPVTNGTPAPAKAAPSPAAPPKPAAAKPPTRTKRNHRNN